MPSMDSLLGLAGGLSTAAGLRVFDEGFEVGTLPLGLRPFQWQRIRNVRAGQDRVTVQQQYARCV
jgi:hypothetical protein